MVKTNDKTDRPGKIQNFFRKSNFSGVGVYGNRIKKLFGGLLLMALFAAAAVSAAENNDGLQLHYNFNEGKGNVVKDLSGKGNDGTIISKSGTEPKWVAMLDDFKVQNHGYALELNSGIEAGKALGLELSGTALTLEIWFKTGPKINPVGLITKSATDWKTFHRGYDLGFRNEIRFWLRFGDVSKAFFSPDAPLKPDTFYHLIATYDGKFVSIYLNGRRDVHCPESRPVVGETESVFRIGSPWTSSDTLVDEVKIYNRALSIEEINASYAADKTKGQYQPLANAPLSTNPSPNLLTTSTFKRCSNPGIPDWWGTYDAALAKDWKGIYGIDASMAPPVPGVQCVRINNDWKGADYPGFNFCSSMTCLPGNTEYTFSVYIKASKPGLVATIDGGVNTTKKFDLTTDWQRYVVSGLREGAKVMGCISLGIKGKGTAWIAAPQLESGLKLTPYRPGNKEIETVADGTADGLPKADCAFLNQPPVIDGKLDDACWQKLPKLSAFTKLGLEPMPPTAETDVRLGRDDKNLYIAFRCHEPEMKKIKAVKLPHDDGRIFANDSVEIFLITDPESTYYYHMAVDSLGTRYDVYNTMKGWNPDWKCVTGKDQDSWTAELAIPLAALNRNTIKNIWRINFGRNRYAGTEPETSSWSLLKCVDFHTPERFGWLTGIPGTLANASTNQLKMVRPLLQAMTEYDFYMNEQSATLLVDWSSNSSATLQVELKEVATGKVLQPFSEPLKVAPSSNSRFKLPLTGLANGKYEITVKAIADRKETAVVKDSFSKLSPNPLAVRVNKPLRCLMVEDKPFLAYAMTLDVQWLRLGKCDVTWQKTPLNKDHWQFDDIKAHGLNSLWLAGLPKADECREVLDECQRKGLKVFLLVHGNSKLSYAADKVKMADFVSQLKDHPAIVAWNIADEPDLWWTSIGRKESELLDLYNTVKAIDPYRPVYINWCFFAHPPFGTLEATDIVSVDRYPLRYNALDFSTGLVTDSAVDINRAAMPGHKPTNFYLQFQGFWDMGREPTPDEHRWMSYMNFVVGTRALTYFSYKPMSVDLWEYMIPFGKELEGVFQLTAAADARELTAGKSGQMFYSLWHSGGNYYLIYVNSSLKSIVANIDLPELKGAREMKALYGPQDVKNDSKRPGNLSFFLRPLQCGVCTVR